MIRVYKKGNNTIWIPVSEKSDGIPSRVFLPNKGLLSKYTHGYKSESEKSDYIEALISIQRAFIDNESKVFWVTKKGELKEENQYKAKWRHNGSLISPTLGWAEIEFDVLTFISDEEVISLVLASDSIFARKRSMTIKPILVESEEELELKIEELQSTIGDLVPEGQREPKKIGVSSQQYVRDATVVAYVLKQADGKCECCDSNSPFFKPNGNPYLEVHHVKLLSDRGHDTVTNAIAVCPNCHREFHHGINKRALVELVYLKVRRLVRE